MQWIKNYSALQNAFHRDDLENPRRLTAIAQIAAALTKICNSGTITGKSDLLGRIKVIIVNKDLGL